LVRKSEIRETKFKIIKLIANKTVSSNPITKEVNTSAPFANLLKTVKKSMTNTLKTVVKAAVGLMPTKVLMRI
jgi:hypothetical protein